MSESHSFTTDRRRLLTGAAALGGAAFIGVSPASAGLPPNPFIPAPMPKQPPFKEGLMELPGTKLYYRDTGGKGPVVVLMHPATGSALIWGYQIPAFAAAGYRVIAYSRRGYNGSEPADRNNGGVPSQDLGLMMDKLGVGKFYAVASAAGCSITLDFAIDHSDRLHAIAVAAGAYGDLDEPEYKSVNEALRPKGTPEIPVYLNELSPSYRAANLQGTKDWIELEHKAINGNRLGPKNANKFNGTTLGRIKAPTLFIAGGADLGAPPTLMRIAAAHVPGADMIVFPDAGHSVYWEQPDAFNKAILAYFRKHRK